MTSAEHESHDITVQIAADRRKHFWVNSVSLKRGRSTRTSGFAPREAGQHSLLAIAIVQALLSVSNKDRLRLTTFNTTRKPSVEILVRDVDFVASIRALVSNDDPRPFGFRAGRNFWSVLVKQLRRFQVTVKVVPLDDGRIGALKVWGATTVVAPRETTDVPAIFLATAVCTTH
ncbi:MAG TPA: hypothetical protein VGF96_05890 [Terracidiphilus sp.]|jgi:hypothetical protein